MRTMLAVLLLVGATWGSSSAVTVETLENGLQVAVEENHAAEVVAIRIYVGVGSVFEGAYLGCGVSHYCEHLVSGGTTANRTEEESRRILAAIGAQVNAYTTVDHTCYHIQCPSAHWETALDLLSDWVMHCALDSAEVARERGVILQEIAMGEDEPRRVLHKLLRSHLFRRYELGVPVIGYRENFARLTHADLADFYHRHYVPNNSLVVVVGAVDPGRAMNRIRETMAAWERRPLNLPRLHQEPRQTAPRRASATMDVGVATVRIGFPTIELADPDLHALDLLACVLGWGESSRLSRRLKDEANLVYDISCRSYTPWFGPGVFTVDARLEPDSIPRMLTVLWEEIEAVKQSPPSPNELETARNQVRASEVFSRQSCQAEASGLGRDLLSTGDPLFSRRYVQGMSQVTPSDLSTVARRYLVPEGQTTARIVPESGTSITEAGPSGSTARSDVESFTLPNGLRVLIRRTGFAPVVALQAYFGGGSHRETEETNGHFRLMSRMLMEGTKKWSAQELRARLDHMGASMECGSGRFTVSLRMTALPEHLEQSLELAAEVLIRPTFPSSRLEKVRQNLLAEIRSEREDWQREAWYFVQRSYYGGHPYSLSPVGTEEAVKVVGVDDLRALFGQCVRGGNGVVAVYGDLDVDRTKELVVEAFSNLPAGELDDVSMPAPEPVAADTTVWRVNDKGQVVVCFGLNGVSLGDDDRYALDVLDAVTSGVNLPGGWLHEALRGDADLAYFVHLMPAWGPTAGNIVVMAQTSVANRERVVASIQAELDRAGRETIGPDELEAGKATCVAAHAIYHQDPGSQADEAALFELYGLGHDFMESYAHRINAVTAEDVQRVARKYLGARVLAMTGPAEAFQDL